MVGEGLEGKESVHTKNGVNLRGKEKGERKREGGDGRWSEGEECDAKMAFKPRGERGRGRWLNKERREGRLGGVKKEG